MTNYINAQVGSTPQSIQYDIDQLTADVCSEGNQAWRHNNVALLPFNISARQANAIGMASGVAIFPDKASSQQAFLAECQRPKYAGNSLGQMINQFIPDYIVEPPHWDEEKNEPVLPWLEPITGLDVNAELTDYDALLTLVEEHIGWQAGSTETIEKGQQAEAPNVSTVNGHNVLINGKTAVHQDSGGVLQTVDVCLTTIGTSAVPIAYPNVAQSSDAASTASSVKINGNPACHLNSNFSKSTGDQPGDKKGVASGTTEGKAEFILGSFDVFIEGKPAVRQGDLMVSNNKNTPPAPLNQPGGPMPTGLNIRAKEALATQSKANKVKIKVSSNEKVAQDNINKNPAQG
ncbi:DUF4150 domain-containing protein [Thalassotalea euphylliae]|uniref:DUF4150 domain-containing protein n=1 Tax=Thalassotalea euphylliae TaxID=1655234 RepID=A0A3E0TPV0_9GAMM|nr:DUF4150 domain-containing protein [Thalassotalea euphylliae]REL26651.1 DUF4150 domain-containing protein [Thalassotalea euphylliae]